MIGQKPRSLRLAAPRIVADNPRTTIEHHRLKTSVRTSDHAQLFAEEQEVKEHSGRRRSHH
ncbi:MAG: hypothetical protein ACK56I_16535, partial [bacterium]